MKTNPAAALLAALNAAPQPDTVPAGWFTMDEIAAMLRMQRSGAYKRIQKLANVETKIFKLKRGQCLRHVPHYRLAG
jgi:hypothetical protein